MLSRESCLYLITRFYKVTKLLHAVVRLAHVNWIYSIMKYLLSDDDDVIGTRCLRIRYQKKQHIR